MLDLEGNNKKCKIWGLHKINCERENQNPITLDELNVLRAMKKELNIHPDISALMRDTANEVTYLFEQPDTGVMCRCRIDMEKESGLLDLKTTVQGGASQPEFRKSIYKWGYHIQAQFYIDAWLLFHPKLETNNFIFIVQEKRPPYLCNRHILNPAYLSIGRTVYLIALDKMREYQLEKPKYLGYVPSGDHVEPPEWFEINFMEYYNLGD